MVSRTNYQHMSVTTHECDVKSEMISGSVKMGLPNRAAQVQRTCVWGVVWWEDFHEEESKGLLLVLHLVSDWLSSPSGAPYKHRAQPLIA